MTVGPSLSSNASKQRLSSDARAALLGAAIAAIVSVVVALVGAVSENTRASTDFFREKQQTAYLNVSTSFDSYQRAQVLLAESVKDDEPAAILNLLQQLEDASNALNDAILAVQLVGSDSAAASAQRLLLSLESTQNGEFTSSSIRRTLLGRADLPLTEQDRRNIEFDAVKFQVTQISSAELASFIEHARRDLGR